MSDTPTLTPTELSPTPLTPEELKAFYEERFGEMQQALLKVVLPPTLEPRRDVILVIDGSPLIIHARRDSFLERFGDDVREAGWYEPIEALLAEIPKAPQFQDGRHLPALIGVGRELRLAWILIITVTAPQYAGPRSSTKYPTTKAGVR